MRKLKYVQLFENFQLNESMENKLPYSITIKLNGDKFLKTHGIHSSVNISPITDRTGDGIYCNNFRNLTWHKKLKLENLEWYPLLKLNRGKGPNEFVYLYIEFNNELSDFGSKGGGIRIFESTSSNSDYTRYMEEFPRFDGPIQDYYKNKQNMGYSENCFFDEFAPGTIDDRGYFEIVSVN